MKATDLIRKKLAAGPKNRGQIVSGHEDQKHAIDVALNAMTKRGEIVKTQEGGHAVYSMKAGAEPKATAPEKPGPKRRKEPIAVVDSCALLASDDSIAIFRAGTLIKLTPEETADVVNLVFERFTQEAA